MKNNKNQILIDLTRLNSDLLQMGWGLQERETIIKTLERIPYIKDAHVNIQEIDDENFLIH